MLNYGKCTLSIEMTKFYLAQGKRVMFATLDQRKTFNMLHKHFPNALFELVDDCGILIHERRK